MKKLLLTTGLIGVLPLQAHAFGGLPDSNELFNFGDCFGVAIAYNSANSLAVVGIEVEGYFASPDATIWNNAAVQSAQNGNIDQGIVEYCFPAAPVTNLTQNGADNGSFAADNYIGFSFDTGGFRYEYALKGATNTQKIMRRVPIETTPPTASITLSDMDLGVGQTSLVTITFTEDVFGFTNADLTVPNGTLTDVVSTDSGRTWTAIFTPTSGVNEPTNAISVVMSGVADEFGNVGSEPIISQNYAIHTQPPTASITFADTELAAGETALVTISFNAPVTGLTNADLTVPNGSLSNVTSTDGGTTWTATFTPTAGISDATNVISLDLAGVTDGAGNAGAGPMDGPNYAVNTALPTASITFADTELAAGETALVTISFNAPVTGLTNADLTVPNGSLSNVTSTDGGTTWTATFTPTTGIRDATNVISLDLAGVTDGAGNAGAGPMDGPNYSVAALATTVTLRSDKSTLQPGETATLTFVLSEASTDFDLSDIEVTGGSLSGFSGSGTTYTVIFTPDLTAGSNASVSIVAGKFSDTAGNENDASNLLLFAIEAISPPDTVVEDTQAEIAKLMYTRANQLAINQPDLIGFLTQQSHTGLGFSANISANQGVYNFASDQSKPVWARIKGAWSTDAASKSTYVLGSFGSHLTINENLLLGGMLQFDQMSSQNGQATISGNGWLIGPYFVSKAQSQPLYFEARLLYGQTQNQISPSGAYTDQFSTNRLLAKFKVAGALHHKSTTLHPFLDFTHTSDQQQAYADGLGNIIAKQEVNLDQFALGLSFATPLAVRRGEMEITGGISGVWSSTQGPNHLPAPTIPAFATCRARLDLGANYFPSEPEAIHIASYYDGLGSQDYESFGFSFTYELKF